MNEVFQVLIAKQSCYRTHGFDLDGIKRSYERFIAGLSDGSVHLRPTSFIFKTRGRAIEFSLNHNTSGKDFESMVGKDWIDFEYSLVSRIELYD